MAKPKLVVLTGAGISAESGLRTFRDSDGLWEGYDINDVATWCAWERNPGLVLEFYNMRRKNVLDARPNAAHLGLAALEKDFAVSIITQNIDDLHERAGSTQVLHLHGEITKMRSVYDDSVLSEIRTDIRLGDAAPDGGQWRPHVVWFGEAVPMIEKAIPIVATADCFAVIGTSLVVYPAAGLVDFAPSGIPRFIMDKKIPYLSNLDGWKAIERPASEGISILQTELSGNFAR